MDEDWLRSMGLLLGQRTTEPVLFFAYTVNFTSASERCRGKITHGKE
jgi:hypothetical protein